MYIEALQPIFKTVPLGLEGLDSGSDRRRHSDILNGDWQCAANAFKPQQEVKSIAQSQPAS